MFVSLLFALFICLVVICFYQINNCWRSSLLSASIIWGVLLTLVTEILSFMRLLTFECLVLVWSATDLLLVLVSIKFYQKHQKTNLFEDKYRVKPQRSLFSRFLLYSIVFTALIIGLTAAISPPNTWDSMTYHMARIVHWVQNGSVDYYPTSNERQLYQKPWSGYAIAHFQILSGGDYFANLIQWFALLGSIVGVSLITKQLGGNWRGQILSSVFCVTIPMGILQGSSTQTDYVVSFWMVCFVYYILLTLQVRKISSALIFHIGSSLGLAFFTKGTAYLFALPFLIWFILAGFKRFKWQLWRSLFGIVMLVILLNINHEIRNVDLYGYPLVSGSEKYTNEVITIGVLLSNIIRNLSLHIFMPIQFLSNVVEKGINILHWFFGIGSSDLRTTWVGTEFHLPNPDTLFHEDQAANTLHLLLILGTITLFLKDKKIRANRQSLYYLVCTVSGFLIFCLVLKWQPWHSRLQLPIFVLFSPFSGMVLSKISNYKLVNYTAISLILSSMLWIFFNLNRPFISSINSPVGHENIFNTNRINLYFWNRKDLTIPYIEAISFVKQQKCLDVGLSIGGDDWEYPFWVLLQQTQGKKYRIEQVNVQNISSNKFKVYPHSNFFPCAIISSNNTDFSTSDTRYIKAWSKDMVSVFTKND